MIHKRKQGQPKFVGAICCDVCMKGVLIGIFGMIFWRTILAPSFIRKEKVILFQQQQPVEQLIEECEDTACLLNIAELALSSRVCGSPAVDGYAHVNATCLELSPSNRWWQKYVSVGGQQQDMLPRIEEAADIDGLAVAWGIGNKVQTPQECAQQCVQHQIYPVAQGPFSKLPCNAFAWCSEEVCFEPDAHTHTKGDCWLKFTEGPIQPEVNMRGDLPDDYRKRHPTAPQKVQWVAGVLLPSNVQMKNGTWGPRWSW
eukprot:TRINITY_DN244_c0_g1_i1.p1 TRINITY_DN244_c0_g1~~TRINITY_DN244_c0_g1_i1.p1  ORF type:complete len:257 (+),score=34.33 TRINITY_DN244_c0_g1_i1:225-995(+)